nr:uncharacterized protein LOC113810005 [Penaeus vannamei]
MLAITRPFSSEVNLGCSLPARTRHRPSWILGGSTRQNPSPVAAGDGDGGGGGPGPGPGVAGVSEKEATLEEVITDATGTLKAEGTLLVAGAVVVVAGLLGCIASSQRDRTLLLAVSTEGIANTFSLRHDKDTSLRGRSESQRTIMEFHKYPDS